MYPHSPSTRPWGWWPATSPLRGQKGQPIQGINPCTSLRTPASRLGFSGAGGTLARGLSPGWTQASQGHMAGHAGPRARWPPTRPLPPLEVLGPELVQQGRRHFARLHLMFRPRLSGFSAATLFSHCLTSFLCGLWRTTVAQALSAARERPLWLCPTLRLAPWAGPSDGSGGPSAHAPGPTMPSAFPFPGALGQWLGLSPTWVLRQAKASQLVTMQRLPRKAPWAARWALTGPPKPLTCWP